MLCIQFGCQPKKTRCRKASGLFYTHFSQCKFGRCQWMKSTCGWDLNLNNRLFRGDFAILQSSGLSFFSFISKNLCKLFVSKNEDCRKYFCSPPFYFQERRSKMKHVIHCRMKTWSFAVLTKLN